MLLAYSTNIGATAFGASLYHIGTHAGFYGIGFEQVGGSLPSAAAAFVYDFVHTGSDIVWVAKIGKNLGNRMMANGCILSTALLFNHAVVVARVLPTTPHFMWGYSYLIPLG
ncbi:hypothetical protein SAMN05216323_10275 [Williamwhitmania taraxaci]|uniref:Uncharacterized protein n=1 Tax=Williamwhitmania taraxaci TaxID=1640674 RepID=A0A1G6KUF1_9BACT|nr:hypothetical protein SAMN05216323_10275 [Williamwhitmania taraxaci]